jgi:hypothetical protein
VLSRKGLDHRGTSQGLAAIDLASPPPRSSIVLDATAPGALSVAHARKAVFYMVFGANGSASKLWMVDLSGPTPARPTELLDFATGVLSFAVSDDGFVGVD